MTYRERAYREHAANLSTLADIEPDGSLRTKLLQLSTQYEELAESLAIPRAG